MINNIEKFYSSREEIANSFRDYIECYLMQNMIQKKDETKGKGLKTLTHKQMLQRLPIDLTRVKTGNNSESLLNEIR